MAARAPARRRSWCAAARPFFSLEGKPVLELPLQGLYQRHNAVRLPSPVRCDELVLRDFQTHGAKELRLFELRLYETPEA